MKITFLLPGYPWKPIGGFRVVYEYANHLVMRGHEVTIIHPGWLQNQFIHVDRDLYIRILRKLVGYFRNVILTPSVKWQYVDSRVKMCYVPSLHEKYIQDADVLFATSWETAEIASGFNRNKGKKFYLIQHYEVWSGPKERVDATWKAPFYKIVIAKWLYKKGLELGVPKEQMIYIPNGIDHDVFKLIEPIEKRAKKIAMMYSHYNWKGGEDGIKALSIVKKQFPEIQCVFFSTMKRSKKIPEWVEYIYNPSKAELVRNIYNKSIIYLCPSWSEGWHLPPAEAMACGCAIVSTNIDGVVDYAINGETAILSPLKKPEMLALNIMKLLKDEKLRIRLAMNGYKYIQKFKWSESTAQLEDFILSKINM